MSRLALEFGISGNGLAKICDRLNVPYPPRGYWARKEAGQKVVTFRLPERGENTPAAVTISPTPPPLELSPAQQEAVAAAKSKTEGIEVPSELKKPHLIIAGGFQTTKNSGAEIGWIAIPTERLLRTGPTAIADSIAYSILFFGRSRSRG